MAASAERASLIPEQESIENDESHKIPAVKVTEPKTVKHAPSQQPYWLTKSALVLFMILFTSCAACLIALDRIVVSQNGLPLSISSNEYSWTYGPTAILVVILSFWRRIDYYYKSSQPWRELQAGPAPTDRSLLLDYISPFQLTAMFHACKFRHYSVAATILSFFILKGIILVSTTLFAVRPTLSTHTLAIQYQDAFGAADAWASPPYRFVSYSPDLRDFEGGSDESIWTYLAKLNGATTNDATWNQDGLTTQRFHLSDSASNVTTLEAPVDIFSPKITCESARHSVLFPSDFDGMTNYMGIPNYIWNSPTCSGGNFSVYLCPVMSKTGTNPRKCGKHFQSYSFYRINCSAGLNEYRPEGTDWPKDADDHDIRYAITTVEYDLKTNASDDWDVKSVEVVNSSSIICKIGYSITSVNAMYNVLTGYATFPDKALEKEGKLLPNLSSSGLAEMLVANLDLAAPALVMDDRIPTINLSGWAPLRASEALFQLMVAKLGSPADLGIFFEESVLKDTSIAVLEGVATEFARESLLVKKKSDAAARGLVSEARLHTRPFAIWTMTAGFFILTTICLLLLLTASTTFWIPAMQGSIAGHATILVHSQPLQDFLDGTGRYDEEQLKQKLEGKQFKAATDSSGTASFSIEMVESSSRPSESSHAVDSRKKASWLPLTGRLFFVIATLTTPVLAIGVLELLQRLSTQRHGLLEMSKTDSSTLSYVVRLATTTVIFAITTMFNSLDFTIVTFSPYSSLRSGSVTAERSILFHLLSVSPFLVLLKSLHRRHFGAAASNISSLLGGFLTIIVSGLWVLTGPITVERTSSAAVRNWDGGWPSNALDDGGAGLILNLIHHGGANTSARIWNDAVLPEVKLSSPRTDNLDPTYWNSNYTYELQALRPTFHCTEVPKENFISNSMSWHTGPGPFTPINYRNNISINLAFPPGCVDELSDGRENLTFGLTITDSDRLWVGQYMDLDITAGDTGCPSVGILFGQVEGNNTKTWNLTALVCSQGIEQLPVTLTFEGDPSLSKVNDQSSRLVPTKARPWYNGTSEAQTMGFRIQHFLTASLKPFINSESGELFDPFFDHLVRGPNKVSKESLTGIHNVEKLIQVVTRGYTEYMRHVIDLKFRATNDSSFSTLIGATAGDSSPSGKPSSANTEITGTSSEAVTRLAVHSTSKIVLQVFLSIMVIFGLASYLLVKLDGTLPRNPCSIASTMAFLAGSQLCDQSAGIIPEGAQFMNDHQLNETFDGWVFSLGWWHERDVSLENTRGAAEPGETLDDECLSDTALTTKDGYTRFGIDVGRAKNNRF